ncbi:uncharacterized protein LOC126681898 [Mercurialis annua]|uniref:uncharacterized protein LOC126681898 n=1 Tax=Mercurialis annua TaxID=3986 RepID=UPI002160B91E|nr:uncharacterized protein LOC126681898 [Mercurialis annua]
MKLLRWEESNSRQKSRALWINLGDQNTKYFHNCIRQRQGRKNIVTLKCNNGSITNEPEMIKTEIISLYQNFLGFANMHRTHVDPIIFNDGYVLIEEDIILPNKPVTPDEIKEKCWGIVGAEVSKAIFEFFNHGFTMKQINSTTITLVLKVLISTHGL